MFEFEALLDGQFDEHFPSLQGVLVTRSKIIKKTCEVFSYKARPFFSKTIAITNTDILSTRQNCIFLYFCIFVLNENFFPNTIRSNVKVAKVS